MTAVAKVCFVWNPSLEIVYICTARVLPDDISPLVSPLVADETVFFLLGEIIEHNNTEAMFSMPKDKRTEDYISGRFG